MVRLNELEVTERVLKISYIESIRRSLHYIGESANLSYIFKLLFDVDEKEGHIRWLTALTGDFPGLTYVNRLKYEKEYRQKHKEDILKCKRKYNRKYYEIQRERKIAENLEVKSLLLQKKLDDKKLSLAKSLELAIQEIVSEFLSGNNKGEIKLKKIRKYINKKYGVDIHHATLRGLFERMGYEYKNGKWGIPELENFGI